MPSLADIGLREAYYGPEDALTVARRHRARGLTSRGVPSHIGGPMMPLEWEAFLGNEADKYEIADAMGLNYRGDLRGIGQSPMSAQRRDPNAAETLALNEYLSRTPTAGQRDFAIRQTMQPAISNDLWSQYLNHQQTMANAPPIAPTTVTHDGTKTTMRPAGTLEEQLISRMNPAQLAAFRKQQGADKVAATEAEARLTTANAALAKAQEGEKGALSDLPKEYQSVINRVLVNAPATRRKFIENGFANVFAMGNDAELRDQIRAAAIQTEDVETKKQIIGRQATLASLNDAESILNEMQAKGVPTGFFSGTVEDLARKVGKTSNPEYVALANRLAGTLINYRRAATGAAFGEREGAAYEKMFPNYKNELPVNLALIQGLKREMKTYDDVYWEDKLGKDGRALVFGSGQPKENGAAMVPMFAPDGRPLMVPADKVAGLEAQGAKRR